MFYNGDDIMIPQFKKSKNRFVYLLLSNAIILIIIFILSIYLITATQSKINMWLIIFPLSLIMSIIIFLIWGYYILAEKK